MKSSPQRHEGHTKGHGEDGGRVRERSNELSYLVVGAAIEVHRKLGPGLLESAYEKCLCREMESRQIPFARQVPLEVEYKGLHLDCAYRLDVVAGDLVIVN